jgi:hypothetical protein
MGCTLARHTQGRKVESCIRQRFFVGISVLKTTLNVAIGEAD